MISLSVIEQDAAKILEFHEFDQSNQNQMVEDMNLCHKGKYSRGARREIFKTILESQAKREEIMEYIRLKRNSPGQSLPSIMTDASVEKVLEDNNHHDDDAMKYWFYRLHPSFSPSEIKQQHEAAYMSISQREIDEYEHKDDLMVHGEHWMEYYNFNMPEFEVEISRDLYRSMVELMNTSLTARMCIKTVHNIYHNQTSARMRIDKKIETVKTTIDNDELRNALQKVQRKARFHRGSEDERNAFVKELFVVNWEDYTINEIKEIAEKFYAEKVTTVGPVAEDRSGNVVMIDSGDSDDDCEVSDDDSEDNVDQDNKENIRIIENIEILDDSDESGGSSLSLPVSKRRRIQ